jgi:hypothetical protein
MSKLSPEARYERRNKKMRSDYKKETGKTLGKRHTSGKASARISFACRFGGMKGDMKKPNGDPTNYAMALKNWGFANRAEAKEFCKKNKRKK